MKGTDKPAEPDSRHEQNHPDHRPFLLASAAVADPNAEVRCREIAFSQSNVGVALGRDRARGALQQTPTNQRS